MEQNINKEEQMNLLKDNGDSKQQMAYRQIKEDILNNVYPEGTILVERRLCDIYKMSRSPIRNALWQLTYEGLLTYVPGKGAAVAGFTIEDILEVYDLIEILQLYAIRVVLNRSSDYTADGLGRCLNGMEECLKSGDIPGASRWDGKFHEFIIQASANRRLKNIYSPLALQSRRFIAITLDDEALARRSFGEHETILRAVEKKNEAMALEGIRTHYKNIKQYYINKLLEQVNL